MATLIELRAAAVKRKIRSFLGIYSIYVKLKSQILENVCTIYLDGG